jgi:chromosome segregation ATPase
VRVHFAGKAGEVAREERDRVERKCASLSSALADAEGKCAALKEECAEGAKERAGALAAFESREAARVAEWSTRLEGAEGEARVSREDAARAKASAAAALTEVRIKDAQLSDAMESNRRLKRELEGEKEERAAEVAGVREGAAELRARLEEVCERVDAAIAAKEGASRLSQILRRRASATSKSRSP